VNVKRFHYDSHDQFATNLADFMTAHDFARRLKTLSGLIPYEFIANLLNSASYDSIFNPNYKVEGLNPPVPLLKVMMTHSSDTARMVCCCRSG
jgi:hypothetical protein